MQEHKVPGGTIYVVECKSSELPTVYRPVFVPSPPRLVRLETENGGHVLVAPAFVVELAPTWTIRDGRNVVHDTSSFLVLAGGQEETRRVVLGSPAEVVARLGLTIDGEA